MQNLIIGIISVVLVVSLAASGYFFGGDIYTQGKVDGEMARYTNEGEQVASALTLYESDGNVVGIDFQVQDLVDMNYLSKLPEGWIPYMNTIASPIAGDEALSSKVCFESNKDKGFIFDVGEPNTIPYNQNEDFAIPICINELDRNIPCCITQNQL